MLEKNIELTKYDPEGSTVETVKLSAWNVRSEDDGGIWIDLDFNEQGISSGIQITRQQLSDMGYIEKE